MYTSYDIIYTHYITYKENNLESAFQNEIILLVAAVQKGKCHEIKCSTPTYVLKKDSVHANNTRLYSLYLPFSKHDSPFHVTSSVTDCNAYQMKNVDINDTIAFINSGHVLFPPAMNDSIKNLGWGRDLLSLVVR